MNKKLNFQSIFQHCLQFHYINIIFIICPIVYLLSLSGKLRISDLNTNSNYITNKEQNDGKIYYWWSILIHVIIIGILHTPLFYLMTTICDSYAASCFLFAPFLATDYLIIAFSLFLGIQLAIFAYFQINTVEYQLSRKLFNKLPLKAKLQYLNRLNMLYSLSGGFKVKDEMLFFEQWFTKSIIRSIKQDVINRAYCLAVLRLAREKMMISNITDRHEANCILKRLYEFKLQLNMETEYGFNIF